MNVLNFRFTIHLELEILKILLLQYYLLLLLLQETCGEDVGDRNIFSFLLEMSKLRFELDSLRLVSQKISYLKTANINFKSIFLFKNHWLTGQTKGSGQLKQGCYNIQGLNKLINRLAATKHKFYNFFRNSASNTS